LGRREKRKEVYIKKVRKPNETKMLQSVLNVDCLQDATRYRLRLAGQEPDGLGLVELDGLSPLLRGRREIVRVP